MAPSVRADYALEALGSTRQNPREVDWVRASLDSVGNFRLIQRVVGRVAADDFEPCGLLWVRPRVSKQASPSRTIWRLIDPILLFWTEHARKGKLRRRAAWRLVYNKSNSRYPIL